MLASYDEELLLLENRREKVVFRGELAPEFVGRVDARVDLAAKPGLCLLERRRKVREPCGADDHEVDVTLRPLERSRNRSVDEGNGDSFPEGRQHVAQQPDNSGSLGDDALEVPEQRVRLLRPEIDATLPW